MRKKKKNKIDISKEITEEISSQIEILRKKLFYFVSGFCILFIAGISFKDVVLVPFMKFLYPPEKIFKELNETISSSTKDETSLKKNLDLKSDIKLETWRILSSGDIQKYEKISFRDAFYKRLENRYVADSEDKFGEFSNLFSPKIQQESLKANIMSMANRKQRADIRIVNPEMNKTRTSCQKLFDHSKLQAVIKVPQSETEPTFLWYRCGTKLSPITYKISLFANDHIQSNIELVGVVRGGDSDGLEMHITQKVARLLNLPDWESYKSRIIGSFKVDDVLINQ